MGKHIQCCMAALLLALGGCGMLGMDKNERRAPLLNPGGTAALTAQPAPPGQAPQSGQDDPYSVYNSAGDLAAAPQDAAFPQDIPPPPAYRPPGQARESGFWSRAAGWFSGGAPESSPPADPSARVRYTPAENVAAIQRNNGYGAPSQAEYPDLAAVPPPPVREDRAFTDNAFAALEAEHGQAEAARQRLVAAGTGGEDITAQLQSSESAAGPEAAQAQPAVQPLPPPPAHLQADSQGVEGAAREAFAEESRGGAPAFSQQAYSQQAYGGRRQVNPEWGEDSPREMRAPTPPVMRDSGGQQWSAAVPAAPVKAATMDAYTAEMLGERILPPEDTQIMPPPSPPQSLPQPLAHTRSPWIAPPAAAAEPPRPLAYAPPPGGGAEAPGAEPVRVEPPPPVKSAESLRPGYQPSYPEYSYYDNERLRLRPPAPVARQTVFLPESRYARRRLPLNQ